MLLIIVEIFGYVAFYMMPVIVVMFLFTPTIRFCPELKRASDRADHAHFDYMNSLLKRRLWQRAANYSLFDSVNGR